jgi:hypothetical protein
MEMGRPESWGSKCDFGVFVAGLGLDERQASWWSVHNDAIQEANLYLRHFNRGITNVSVLKYPLWETILCTNSFHFPQGKSSRAFPNSVSALLRNLDQTSCHTCKVVNHRVHLDKTGLFFRSQSKAPTKLWINDILPYNDSMFLGR